jgi:hypothetical protein
LLASASWRRRFETIGRLDPAACSVLEFDQSIYHYKSRRREQAGLEADIK